ncbi:MAG: serine/threonine protein kinase [Bdellovibrionaceae bacterium]|nr:serine/threonine protein kinase [Pseudobdellovibrionaceae bacterium]
MKFQKLGKYTLLELISANTSTEVYLAVGNEADGIHNFIAIKQFPKASSSNEEYVNNFLKNARIFSHLEHPNIVNIKDFGNEQSNLFFAMEYVHGKTLLQIVQALEKDNRQLPTEHVAHIIREIAKGLDYIHMASTSESEIPLNIIHHQVYPQNILVGYNGEIKIFDFGIPKPEKTDSEIVDAHKKKLGYLSPEEIRKDPIDYRIDIYALGVIAWELLANRKLFQTENGFEIMKKTKDGDIPDITPFLDPKYAELASIVNVCLATDRELRYQTGQHIADELEAFMKNHFPEYSQHVFSEYIKSLFFYYHEKSSEKLDNFTRSVFGSIDNTEYTPEKESKLTESVIIANPVGPLKVISLKDIPSKERKWWEYGIGIAVTLIFIFIVRIIFVNYFR